MKITRILPRPFALSYQEYDIRRLEAKLGYHRAMAELYEELLEEAKSELRRLGKEW